MNPDDATRPTQAHPGLAMVMVPRTGAPAEAPGTLAPGTPTNASGIPTSRPATTSATTPTESTPTDAGTGSPAWVFPFDQPLPPEPGDNQTLAVNTTDNTVVYDIAFALVWVDDQDPVTDPNEAYAFASCTNCAAVAVSFQVVLVVGDADVVVPQNLAGALNYNCIQCLTYALATQLLVTLNGPLSVDGMAALNELWAQIADFARHLTDYPLDELRDRLTAYEQQILASIQEDRAITLPSTTTGATPASTDATATDPTATESTDATEPTDSSSTTGSTPQSTTSSTTESTTTAPSTTTAETTVTEPTTSSSSSDPVAATTPP